MDNLDYDSDINFFVLSSFSPTAICPKLVKFNKETDPPTENKWVSE